MKRFLCGILRLIAWVGIIAGLILTGPHADKWSGVAIVALGFSTLTVVTFVSGRITIYSQHGDSVLAAEESPISFMVVLTGLFFISCSLIVLAIVDLVRHLRTGQ